MKTGLDIWRCAGCGARCFPERLLCPRCHGADFERETVATGVVEEISMIHHMLGQPDWKPRPIANVRTEAGIDITVGLLDDAGEGSEIDLYEDNGAPFGRIKGEPSR